jgi:hypothetical protein
MAGQELVLRFMAFKTLDEDEFKTMNRFLDLAMEEISQYFKLCTMFRHLPYGKDFPRTSIYDCG